MSTDQSHSRFCVFCSLLCEPPDFAPGNDSDLNLSGAIDFGASFCSRRNREIESGRSLLVSRETVVELASRESLLEGARDRMANASQRLITGRMRSVATCRGALRVAQRWGATVDSWDSQSAFESIAGFQRSGGITVSLAEARDITELFLIVGGDSLIEDYPRLPAALSRGAAVPVLLFGSWSHRGCKPWLDAGFEVLAIDTPIESLPRSLAQATAMGSVGAWESQASQWLHRPGYETVLWSMKHLELPHGDLWYESMMEWIGKRNETKRAGAISWSDLNSNFHQVCTWWTGFPGRIRWEAEALLYDPSRFTAERWLEDAVSNSRRSSSVSSNRTAPLILWIDDSTEEIPSSVCESGLDCIAISPRSPGAARSGFAPIWLPSQPAGLGVDAEFFRGDHALLVRGRDCCIVDQERLPPSQWCRGLLES